MLNKRNPEEEIAFLRRSPLFKELPPAAIETLLDDMRFASYQRGDIIFRQGSDSRRLFMIRSGKVKIYKNSLEGNKTIINIFGASDVFGEFAAVDGLPRSATAQAVTPCAVVWFYAHIFEEHMRRTPGLAIGMSKLLTGKVRWTAEYAETIAQLDMAGRLLHILLAYQQQFGEQTADGEQYVLDLSLNQSDLASLVGARREWVNRKLSAWRKRGLLEYRNGKIIILDLPRVKAERDSRRGR